MGESEFVGFAHHSRLLKLLVVYDIVQGDAPWLAKFVYNLAHQGRV